VKDLNRSQFEYEFSGAKIYGDPGVIIQRIIIDWGGLKDTYAGPSVALKASTEHPRQGGQS
jgi:hypothetical protein